MEWLSLSLPTTFRHLIKILWRQQQPGPIIVPPRNRNFGHFALVISSPLSNDDVFCGAKDAAFPQCVSSVRSKGRLSL